MYSSFVLQLISLAGLHLNAVAAGRLPQHIIIDDSLTLP